MIDDDLAPTETHDPLPARLRGDAMVPLPMKTDQPLQGVIAALESFNGMVSHDLVGPLAGITHLADLALRALAHGQVERVAKSLTLIRQQGRMSSQLLASLLVLARAAKAGPDRQPIELSSVVARALEQVKLERREAGRVEWVLRALPVMNVDPTLLQQVFVNLIGNAVKFSATVASPRIEVGTQPAGSVTALFVRDNGVGFDERAARFFAPFTRFHGAAVDGAGIGLSIVHRIVDIHEGRIWCESRVGHGATVYFTLAPADS